MDAGQLVPDEVTNAMVADRLAQPDAAPGFLLDGYPRNLGQADVLAEPARGSRHPPRRRGRDRRRHRAGASQRLLARGQGRADDTEDVIRHRLEVYASETAPLVDYYRERGPARAPSTASARSTTSRPGSSPRSGLSSMFGRKSSIELKKPEQLRTMRAAGLVVADTLAAAPRRRSSPGMTTADLDVDRARDHRRGRCRRPSFLGYHGYPAVICIVGQRRDRPRHPRCAGDRRR